MNSAAWLHSLPVAHRGLHDKTAGIPENSRAAFLAAAEAGYAIEDGGAWISKEADVLIPAALEGQVNADTIKLISSRVKIIAEGANGPTTPEADEVIKAKNIFLIPDFLCNSGGVTVSYFESVQNDMNFYWTKEEVLEKLDEEAECVEREVEGAVSFFSTLKNRQGMIVKRSVLAGLIILGTGVLFSFVFWFFVLIAFIFWSNHSKQDLFSFSL